MWALLGFVVIAVYTLAFALARMAKRADDQHPVVLDRTTAMCEHGACRERWTVLVNLGAKGHKWVCDAHVNAVVSEAVEPQFEASGVPELPKRHLAVVR